MTGTAPLLSVVIPVFNRAGTVGRAIASVAGPCAAPFELIVVDDGSSDGSAAAARAAIAAAGLAGIGRVVVQENAGPGAARNRGAALARGRHLAFLDSDDAWFPWTLGECARAAAAAPEAALFFLQNLNHEGAAVPEVQARPPVIERHARYLEAILATRTMRFGSCNLVMRRDVFLACGGFTDRIRCNEDTDLFLRADASGPCILIKDAPMMVYREGNADSLTADLPCVAAGLDYALAMERGGRYPGGRGADPARTRFLANICVRTARIAFAAGHASAAYRITIANLGLIGRGGQARWLPRLLLTPILSRLRPASYPFRLRPVPGWLRADGG